MNKMLGYLKDYKRESVLAPLFKMLEATFDLFVPLVMADIVNIGIAAHDFHYILVRCGILLLLAMIGLACSLTAQYFSAKAAVGYSTALRHALFEHIQTLSFTEMDTLGTSTLITRMTSDVNQVQSGLNLFLRLFLRSPFVVIGAMVMELVGVPVLVQPVEALVQRQVGAELRKAGGAVLAAAGILAPGQKKNDHAKYGGKQDNGNCGVHEDPPEEFFLL